MQKQSISEVYKEYQRKQYKRAKEQLRWDYKKCFPPLISTQSLNKIH